MADIAPGGVTGTGSKIVLTAGATIAKGDWVYADSTANGKMKPASNAAAASAVVRGVAMNDAILDGDVLVLVDREYDPGVALTDGVLYVLSTGGAMAPVEDHTGAINGPGKYVTYLGRGNSAGKLDINIDVSKAALV